MGRLTGSVLRLLALAALCSQALSQCGCPNSPPYGFNYPAWSGPPPGYYDSPARRFFSDPTGRNGPIAGPQGPPSANPLFSPVGRSIRSASPWDPVGATSPSNPFFTPVGNSNSIGGYIPGANNWNPVGQGPSVVPGNGNLFGSGVLDPRSRTNRGPQQAININPRRPIPWDPYSNRIGGNIPAIANWNSVGQVPPFASGYGYPPSNVFGTGGVDPRFRPNWGPRQPNIRPGRPTPELYGPPWALDPSIPRPLGNIIMPNNEKVTVREFQLIMQHFVRFEWRDIILSNGVHITAWTFEEFESKTLKMSEATIALSPYDNVPVCRYCNVIKCLKDPKTKFEMPDGTTCNLLDIPKNKSLEHCKKMLFPPGFNFDDPYKPLTLGPFRPTPFRGQPPLLPPSPAPSPPSSPGSDEPCKKDGHNVAVVKVEVHPCKGESERAEREDAEAEKQQPRITPGNSYHLPFIPTRI